MTNELIKAEETNQKGFVVAEPGLRGEQGHVRGGGVELDERFQPLGLALHAIPILVNNYIANVIEADFNAQLGCNMKMIIKSISTSNNRACAQ